MRCGHVLTGRLQAPILGFAYGRCRRKWAWRGKLLRRPSSRTLVQSLWEEFMAQWETVLGRKWDETIMWISPAMTYIFCISYWVPGNLFIGCKSFRFHAWPRYCNQCIAREALTSLDAFCLVGRRTSRAVVIPDIDITILTRRDYMLPIWTKRSI